LTLPAAQTSWGARRSNPSPAESKPLRSSFHARSRDRAEAPTDRVVGVLYRQTYQGGTRGSRLCGEDRDRETENSKVCTRTWDTRFIQVQVAKVANPTSCLGIKSMAPCAWCWFEIRCPAMYLALLYIVQGRVPSRLQGRSPSRITRYKS
jgi:hypothetical protein